MVVVNELVTSLSAHMLNRQIKLATAESCTGGMLTAYCTDLSGSSAWFERGFVTYSNEAKMELLGVPSSLIECDGAVSESVALAMALGASYRSSAQASIAVTGIAGPTGGSVEKPVGTVWVAWCVHGLASAEKHLFTGDRSQIRLATCQVALRGLLERIR